MKLDYLLQLISKWHFFVNICIHMVDNQRNILDTRINECTNARIKDSKCNTNLNRRQTNNCIDYCYSPETYSWTSVEW